MFRQVSTVALVVLVAVGSVAVVAAAEPKEAGDKAKSPAQVNELFHAVQAGDMVAVDRVLKERPGLLDAPVPPGRRPCTRRS